MKTISHIASYPFSLIFHLFFGLGLLFFDIAQRLMFSLFGYQAHKVSVDIFNLYITRCLHILGVRYSLDFPESLPKEKPVIIVSNHQSMWDIPPLIWFLRSLHVKFISKKELGKGIPAISYNLQKGGSVLIDRKDPKQATNQIIKVAHYISKYNRAVVIFPEGSRSREGQPKPFKRTGLLMLLKNAPDACILPVSIKNSWKLQRYGMFPMPLGVRFKMKIHDPISSASIKDPKLFIERLEQQIHTHFN